MAVWKKLNPETREYEEIPGAGFSEENKTEPETETTPDLSGKTAIFMGDSYTVAMKARLESMCAEFGLTSDNRGVVSSSICGDVEGNKGFAPMWNRTNSVCTEYTESGTTDDVALFVFMGGANDGFGLETWIGSGIADTDTERIYGAMHSILNTVRNTFPKAKILTVLQPSSFSRQAASVTDDETAAILGFVDVEALQKMDDYQFSNYAMFVKEQAVAEVATFYNTAILDCCFRWHSVLNADDRKQYWNADKLHLSSAGYDDLTKAIRGKIVKLFSEEGDNDNAVYFAGVRGTKNASHAVKELGFLNPAGDRKFNAYWEEEITDENGMPTGQVLTFYGDECDETVVLRGVHDPIMNHDAANKRYVDKKVAEVGNCSEQNVDQPWHYLKLSEDNADAQANSDAITAAIAEHKYVVLKSGNYPVTGNIVIDSGHLAMNKARLFVVDPNHSGHIVELRGEKPTIGDGEIEGCFHTPYGDPNYIWREDEQCIRVAGVNDAHIYNMDLHNVWGAGLATNHVYGERVAVDPKYLEGIAATNTGAGRCTFRTPKINIPDGHAYISAVGHWGFNYIIAVAPVRYVFYDVDGAKILEKSDTPRMRIPIPAGAKTVEIYTICPTAEFISYYLYFTNYRENILVENTLFHHCNQAGWNNPCGPSTIRNCGFLDIGKPYPEAVVTNPKGGWGIDIEDQQCPQFVMDGCWSTGCTYMLIFGGYNGTVSNCHGDQIGAYRGWNLMLSNCVLKRLYTNSNGTDNIVTHSVYAETLGIDPDCLTQIHGDISTMRICSALSRFDRFTVAADTSSSQAEVAAGRLVGTVTGKTAVGTATDKLHPKKGSDLCVVTPGSEGCFTALGDSWGITSDAPWLPKGYVIRGSKFTVSYARKFTKDSGVESSGLFENCTFDLSSPYFNHKQSVTYVPGQPTILTFRDCVINNDGVYLFNYKPKPGSVITFERCTVSDPTHIINPNGRDLSDITIRFLDYSPEEYTVLSDKSSGYDYNIIIRDGALVPVCRATGIEITTPPTKTAYTVGDALDLSGMVVSVLRQDGTKEEISDYTAPTELPGDGVVTIRYTEFGGTYTATLTVTVTEAADE